MSLEPRDRAVDGDRLVDGPLGESPAAPAEETDLPVGIEPAVADPASPEDVSAWHRVANRRRPALEDHRDLRAKLGRNDLVGIDRQDPLAGGLIEAEVLLRGEPRP